MDDEEHRKPGISSIWIGWLVGAWLFLIPLGGMGQEGMFESLRNHARKLASTGYNAEEQPRLPAALAKINYDEFQRIKFKPDHSPWHSEGLPFSISPVHRGFLFRDAVKLRLVESGRAERFAFAPTQFDYDRLPVTNGITPGLDFAGFKVVYTSAVPPHRTAEVASFLGASYFRIVGMGQQYGSSCRVLAVDTGEAAGEEFPRLTEFYIEKPGKGASHLRVAALLDSPSVAGACQFLIQPGEEMHAEVEVSLFPRAGTKKYGFAPLTSMFLTGEAKSRFIADFRPEVHDADGLLLAAENGAWQWQPLSNPSKRHRITKIEVNQLNGFGLMQRDRGFPSYEDLEARYDLRPSLWVQPLEPWGAGHVELVEIPSDTEYNDNIVAFWVPKERRLEPGQEVRLRYRVSALSREPAQSGLLRVLSTRIQPQQKGTPPLFVLDFSGDSLLEASGDSAVQAIAYASRGKIRNLVTQPNPVYSGWRVTFVYEPPGDDPAELRVSLHSGSKEVSETWVYQYGQP